MGKRKLKFFNMNVCQLIDKGNMKLYYNDDFKIQNKKYNKIKQKVKKQKDKNGE